MLCELSWCCGPCTGAVPEVMPTEADARTKQHSDSCAQAAGSQLRCIHGGLRGWLNNSEAKIRATPSLITEVTNPPPFELSGMELPAIAITALLTSIEFPITPVAVVVATA